MASLSFPKHMKFAYTVGAGEVGKSYLVAKGDAFFVSPISFYTRINGWELSPGYDRSLFRGFSRPVVELCVDCHTGQPRFVSGRPDHFQEPASAFLASAASVLMVPGRFMCSNARRAHRLRGRSTTPSSTRTECPQKSVTMSVGSATSSATPGSCGQEKTISTSGPEHRWTRPWPFFLFPRRSRRTGSSL